MDVEPRATPQALEIPPQLVAELAVGSEEPSVVAARYGIEGRRWEELAQWPPFLNAVEAQRAEFEKSGFTFKVKSAMKADALADQVFIKAMTQDATLIQKMEALKLFAKLGELEPSPKANVATGPSFSITIDLGNAGRQKTVTVVENKPAPVVQLEDEPVDKITNTTVGFAMPDFDLSPTSKGAVK